MISVFHARSSSILSGAVLFVCKRHSGVRALNFEFLLTKFRVQCYSTKKSGGGSSRKRKIDPQPLMKDEKEAFFVVRKGDLIGVYKSLSDCQAQAGTSICDPPVSIYKGYSMPKDSEKYFHSCGLKNALYTLRVNDIISELFGTLVECPLQLTSKSETSTKPMPQKISHEAMWSDDTHSCILEFDGGSSGDPREAGAGAILRSHDGSLIYKLREGLGDKTNNQAEYCGLILGMKYALEKGFTSIQVKGDSELICKQVQGLYKVHNVKLIPLWDEAMKLKDQFVSFQIAHILRPLNSEADEQAGKAKKLLEGEIQEEIFNDSYKVC